MESTGKRELGRTTWKQQDTLISTLNIVSKWRRNWLKTTCFVNASKLHMLQYIKSWITAITPWRVRISSVTGAPHNRRHIQAEVMFHVPWATNCCKHEGTRTIGGMGCHKGVGKWWLKECRCRERNSSLLTCRWLLYWLRNPGSIKISNVTYLYIHSLLCIPTKPTYVKYIHLKPFTSS
jgi:hypothetical protein